MLLARNWRHGRHEIDIVARKTDLLVLVEVRTRAPGAPVVGLASVDAKKRAHLLRAAELFALHELPKHAGLTRMRIDVAGVSFGPGGAEVHYAEGAISAS